MTADLITDFPILGNLTQDELDKALATGGLGQALMRARIRKVISPPKPGRPATARLSRKVIQRRGRKAVRQIHAKSTNIQLAEMANAWRDTFRCNAREAVRQTFIALGISTDKQDINSVAKLLSDLPGRKHDRTVANDAPTSNTDSTLFGQLIRASTRR